MFSKLLPSCKSENPFFTNILNRHKKGFSKSVRSHIIRFDCHVVKSISTVTITIIHDNCSLKRLKRDLIPVHYILLIVKVSASCIQYKSTGCGSIYGCTSIKIKLCVCSRVFQCPGMVLAQVGSWVPNSSKYTRAPDLGLNVCPIPRLLNIFLLK